MGGSRGMLVCSNYKLCLPYFGQNLGHKVGYRLLRKPVAHIYFRFVPRSVDRVSQTQQSKARKVEGSIITI